MAKITTEKAQTGIQYARSHFTVTYDELSLFIAFLKVFVKFSHFLTF